PFSRMMGVHQREHSPLLNQKALSFDGRPLAPSSWVLVSWTPSSLRMSHRQSTRSKLRSTLLRGPNAKDVIPSDPSSNILHPDPWSQVLRSRSGDCLRIEYLVF